MKHRLPHSLITAILIGMMASCGSVPLSTGVVATPSEIKEAIRNSEAALTLVHVWATWCDPCREEFPELLQAYQYAHDQGLALQLISADDPDALGPLNDFLQQHQSPVDSLVTTELNQEFIELFSTNWAGALPASFFFDANGTLVAEWAGTRSYEEYIQTIDQLLKP